MGLIPLLMILIVLIQLAIGYVKTKVSENLQIILHNLQLLLYLPLLLLVMTFLRFALSEQAYRGCLILLLVLSAAWGLKHYLTSRALLKKRAQQWAEELNISQIEAEALFNACASWLPTPARKAAEARVHTLREQAQQKAATPNVIITPPLFESTEQTEGKQ